MTNPAMTRLGLVLANASEPDIVPPGPGIYPDVPAHVYHSWDYASNSRLSQLHRSPAHLRAYLDQPAPDKTHFIVGRAVHSAILEPDDFAKRYVCASAENDRRTKAGKEEWAWLEQQHGAGYVLKQHDYDMILGMRQSVLKHPKASKLVNGKGRSELSVVWDDPGSGLRCKARFDRHSSLIAGGAIIDIKSTRDASRPAFERATYEFGYHRQAAMYLAAAKAVGLDAEHFVVIAIEKELPYVIGGYRVDEGALDAGEEQVFGKRDADGVRRGGLLGKYAECQRTNHWPGYSENIEDIALPAYAWGQIEQEVTAA